MRSFLLYIVTLIALASLGLSLWLVSSTPKIAYVESGIIMQQFTPAIKARQQLEQEKAKWQADLKILEDSAKATIEALRRESKSAGKQRLSELQQKFAKQNNDYGRFKRSNEEQAVAREREVLQQVVEKINGFLKEWGDKNGYDIIFGTTGRQGRADRG
jgi:outer membrane protein